MIERAEQLLQDPRIAGTDVKVPWKLKAGEAELKNLVEFILSLDFDHYSPKTLQRKEILPAAPTAVQR